MDVWFALIGVALGGAIGIVGTLITVSSALKLSREERDDARREKANLELLLFVQRVLNGAQDVTIQERENALAKEFATQEEMNRVVALSWFASAQVRKRYLDVVREWTDWMKATSDADLSARFERMNTASHKLGIQIADDMRRPPKAEKEPKTAS